jgi:hypothetical protein
MTIIIAQCGQHNSVNQPTSSVRTESQKLVSVAILIVHQWVPSGAEVCRSSQRGISIVPSGFYKLLLWYAFCCVPFDKDQSIQYINNKRGIAWQNECNLHAIWEAQTRPKIQTKDPSTQLPHANNHHIQCGSNQTTHTWICSGHPIKNL